MKAARGVVAILWAALVLEPVLGANGAYQAWREQSCHWIRVGLKQPEDKAACHSRDTLLVLDGDTVVQTLNPGGSFWIIHSAPRKGKIQYYVQLQASREREALLTAKTKAERLVHVGALLVRPKPGSTLWTLSAGPYPSKATARKARNQLADNGFDDAFLVRETGVYRFEFVDDRFDKTPLASGNLGLVAQRPQAGITYQGTTYRGILRFRMEKGEIRVINELPLESYLRGVVPAEMGPVVYPELDALKAQAIAARTYALKNMGRFSDRGYDICDSPACQAYGGMNAEHEMSDQAVAQTEHMVLFYQGEMIDALYTSTCGGHTDDVEYVFPGRSEPYLKGSSSYVADFRSWELPEKPAPDQGLTPLRHDLVAQLMILGLDSPPRLNGRFTSDDMVSALQGMEWIWGPVPVGLNIETWDSLVFWGFISQWPFFEETVSHQVKAPDIEKGMIPEMVEHPLAPFITLMKRYDVLGDSVWENLMRRETLTREQALLWMLQLTRHFGPEVQWKTYKVHDMVNDRLVLRRGDTLSELNLNDIRFYLKRDGDLWRVTSHARVRELDLVHVPFPPFKRDCLWVQPLDDVGSVDRFSPYSSWVEKKTADEIEAQARRYVSRIRGLRDIEIMGRSPQGRVTRLALIADSGRHEVDGLRIRWSLGVRDNLFDMLACYDQGRLLYASFVGRGWGHGVGMSQVGAYGLARMGWTFREILKHYYAEVEIGLVSPVALSAP